MAAESSPGVRPGARGVAHLLDASGCQETHRSEVTALAPVPGALPGMEVMLSSLAVYEPHTIHNNPERVSQLLSHRKRLGLSTFSVPWSVTVGAHSTGPEFLWDHQVTLNPSVELV